MPPQMTLLCSREATHVTFCHIIHFTPEPPSSEVLDKLTEFIIYTLHIGLGPVAQNSSSTKIPESESLLVF